MNYLEKLGALFLNLCQKYGAYVLFSGLLVKNIFFALKRFELTIRSIYFTGFLSLPIILFAGFFVGMVLALQAYVNMVRFGAEQSVGIMVALTLMRELGSVVSALLFAGRAGSALTAEISLMKTTEQLSALEMMGINSKIYLGVPRFLATLISLPLLAILFVAVAIFGAYLIGVVNLGIDNGIFWGQMQQNIDFYSDIVQGVIIKSFVFAIAVSSLALFEGFTTEATAAGIGKATTRTVVFSSLSILGFDFILTAIMFGN